MSEEPYAGLREPRTRAVDAVLLTCGHSAIFDPLPRRGDILYCYRCADYSHIKFTAPVAKQIRIIQCRDCHFRRRLIQLIGNAKTLAETHAIKKSHVVDISDATKIIGTVTGSLPNRVRNVS